MRTRRRHAEAGLTLVELMIAIALMLIMTLQLQIIFGHSRKLYLGADALAQVYSNVRTALDQIEKDVTNAVKSDQMEFFNDDKAVARGIGHYNANSNEENHTVSLQSDLVPGHYVHSLLVKEEEDYTPRDTLKVGGPYRHDMLYFRTFTNIAGTPREVLVHYRLFLGLSAKDPRERPILQRRLIAPKVDKAGLPQYDSKNQPIYERGEWQDVCYYVQEFKVELFITDKSRPGHVGNFYSPKDVWVQRLGAQRGATPEDSFPPSLVNLLPSNKEYAVECLTGSDDIDPSVHLKMDVVQGHNKPRLHVNNGDRLSQLAPGDKMYCVASNGWDYNSTYMTVKHVTAPAPTGGEAIVEFEESSDIEKAMAKTTDFNVSYRSGWLPQAIRVQLKIKDQRSSEIRTISRIYRLLRA